MCLFLLNVSNILCANVIRSLDSVETYIHYICDPVTCMCMALSTVTD